MRRPGAESNDVRAASLVLLLVACASPPAMESDPNVLWFRSHGVVGSDVVIGLLKENAASRDPWAGPLYLLPARVPGGMYLLGHQRLFLGEYETSTGRFRTVDPADDRTMACVALQQTLARLAAWSRRDGVRWDLQVGLRRGSLPGDTGAIERHCCGDAIPSQVDEIDRRYGDRPR
jgi:hypothetical protein